MFFLLQTSFFGMLSCSWIHLESIKLNKKTPSKLTDIVKFYVKFRRIIHHGKRLQKDHGKVGEMGFQRRLERVKIRL